MRLAASVVLVRNAVHGPEVLLVQRSAKSSFAKSMYAFAGGALDPHDQNSTLTLHHSSNPTELDVLKTCALREAFEEVSVLLSMPSIPPGLSRPWTAKVHDDAALFPKMFSELKSTPSFDLLHPWCRIVTPLAEPKRFDTQFFVAQCDGDAAEGVVVDGKEIVEARWINIHTAISECDKGNLRMLPPQWIILRDLAEFKSCEAITQAAIRRDVLISTAPIRPHFLARDTASNTVTITMPGDEDHDAVKGGSGTRNRVKCKLPIGGPYSLEIAKVSGTLVDTAAAVVVGVKITTNAKL